MDKKMGKDEKVPYLVGLDVGFGQLKWISNAFPRPQVIPSGIMRGAEIPDTKTFDFQTVDHDNLIISTTEGTFYVGKHALDIPGSTRTRIRDRAHDELSRVLFRTTIGLALPHEEGNYKVYVVTGLPNDDYRRGVKDHLEDFLDHPFSVTFHLSSDRSITKNIEVVKVDILRQPHGTVTNWQFRFDQERFWSITERAKEMIGVIDVGHFTTDYALFRRGEFLEKPRKLSGSCKAVTEVYERLKDELADYFDRYNWNFKADDKQLDTVIRTGEVDYAGRRHDVAEQVERATREVTMEIAQEVLNAWDEVANNLEVIVLTGGGAHVFASYLKEEFEKRNTQGFMVVENPEFSNVIGFYMYGAFTMAAEQGKEKALDNYINHVFLGETV